MDQFLNIVFSEYLWGVLTGVGLTYLGAQLNQKYFKISQVNTVNIFCDDSINNICEYIQSLDDHRDRARVIDRNFIDLLEVEISIYGRNREHLIHIKDKQARKNVRDFYTNVMIQVVKIKEALSLFSEASKFRNACQNGSEEYVRHNENALAFLGDAHTACDRLVRLANQKNELLNDLNN